ncbi:MAG: UDP-galactopyranose mutase [Methylophilaceae bacterium]|jgi:UDP-galactopyranose mutase
MSVLIVGAGFSGATIARILAESGIEIKVIDARDHMAGNAYDFVNEYQIRVHKYGPHLFHTSNQEVVNFLSRFTEWTPYYHKVKAMLGDGRLVTLPVNKETSEIVGKNNVLDIFFRPYTKKMWGMSLEEINPSIIQRIPIRDDLNEFYFPKDTFQALPSEGYTSMVEKMLDHPLINIRLNTSFDKSMLNLYEHCFNSMSIDEFFDNIYGNLPYRSIKFHTYTLPLTKVFPVSVVNFTHEEKYSRVTEWKNLPCHGENKVFSTLTFEEPCDYTENHYERYYPVKDIQGANRNLYHQYKSMTPGNVTFIGRCGLYAYLDMHQAVASAMSIAKKYVT